MQAIYYSTARPAVRAYSDPEKQAAQWADAHPVVWDIGAETQSAVFGRGGAMHHALGTARFMTAAASLLQRARVLYHEAHAQYGLPFWAWRLDFALTHYGEPGYASAMFYAVDYDQKPRCWLPLDYTPDTLPDVAAHFKEWARPYRPFIVARRLAMHRPDYQPPEWTETAEIARWRWMGTAQLEALDATRL